MPRLQRSTTLPKNSLVLLLKKAGKHLRRRQGEEKRVLGARWGKVKRQEKKPVPALSDISPRGPSSCVSGISAEFKQGLGFIQGLCWFECGILPNRLKCFNTRSPAGGGV